MIKKIALAICMCTALGAHAQKIELGIAGGVNMLGGYGGSVAGYLGLWRLQVGAVAERRVVERFLVFGPNASFVAFSPGANFNVTLPFRRGYAYPGVKYRRFIGRERYGSDPMKGYEVGVHGGVVLKIYKSLYANAELGLSRQTVKNHVYEVSSWGEVSNYERQTNDFTLPVLLGLRWAF